MSHSFLPDLNKEMKCGVLSNTRGQILIIYDQDITSTIQWIEYDPADVKFTLIHEDGETQEIGVPIDSKMKYNLLNGQEVTLVQMSDKEIKSTQIVVLVIKEY